MMKRGFLKNQKGQTSVEYILMLVVVVTIITSVMGIVKRNLLGDGKDCSGANSKAFYCQFKALYEINSFREFKIYR